MAMEFVNLANQPGKNALPYLRLLNRSVRSIPMRAMRLEGAENGLRPSSRRASGLQSTWISA
jgi:hypothetical protein